MAETKKVKVGVVGVGRGTSMMRYCECSGNAEIVAICDNWEQGLKDKLAELNDKNITGYTSYDEFLKHDMDVVVLANFATEHAPFAIKAMNAGKHVISEVLPCQTLKEAVELIETVERTGKEYLYLENYCFMRDRLKCANAIKPVRSVKWNTPRANTSTTANASGSPSRRAIPSIGATICIPRFIARIPSAR